MNWIKKLFGFKAEEGRATPSPNRYFSIEYYPLTKRYYPKYKNDYLGVRANTGIIELMEDYLFSFADYGKTEDEAKKLIELFKEQRLKDNVKVIYVND